VTLKKTEKGVRRHDLSGTKKRDGLGEDGHQKMEGKKKNWNGRTPNGGGNSLGLLTGNYEEKVAILPRATTTSQKKN